MQVQPVLANTFPDGAAVAHRSVKPQVASSNLAPGAKDLPVEGLYDAS